MLAERVFVVRRPAAGLAETAVLERLHLYIYWGHFNIDQSVQDDPRPVYDP